jgi:redox-sensitive bicupin YhaK (pirin superfamily)
VAAEKNVKISIPVNDEIERLMHDHEAPKGFVANVLLSFAMKTEERIEEAFREWQEAGSARMKARRKGSVPIRPTATDERS